MSSVNYAIRMSATPKSNAIKYNSRHTSLTPSAATWVAIMKKHTPRMLSHYKRHPLHGKTQYSTRWDEDDPNTVSTETFNKSVPYSSTPVTEERITE